MLTQLKSRKRSDFHENCLIFRFKGPYADHILTPQGSTGSSTFFLYQMKAHIFLIANPKFQLQILCSFGDITKSVKLNGIPENNFHNSLIPRGAYFLLPLDSKQEASSGWNFTKCISEVKVNQLKVKNMHVRMGISTFNNLFTEGCISWKISHSSLCILKNISFLITNSWNNSGHLDWTYFSSYSVTSHPKCVATKNSKARWPELFHKFFIRQYMIDNIHRYFIP